MNAARGSEEKRIFLAAYRLPPEEWNELVARECEDDAALQDQVLALLRARQRRLEARGEDPRDGPSRSGSGAAEPRAFSPQPDDALVGRTVGRYRVCRRIGQGGMGRVYEAVDEESGRRVALKVLRGGFTAAFLERFEREAEILWKLSHPAVARIYDAGAEDLDGEKIPVIAMEYILGARNLLEHATEEGLTIDEKLDLFVSVCDGVHSAHEAQVLHRDIKPDNILVAPNGQPKVIDFGVARLLELEDSASRGLTGTGQLVGTLPYMSPEQCDAVPGGLDVRSDVYSLGVVLYELLTAAMPYPLRGASPTEVLRIIRSVRPARPSLKNAKLRGDLERIILMTLEKDRELRYPSAIALADDIRRFRRGEAVLARPPSALKVAKAFWRANRVLVLASAVLLGVFVAGSLWSYFWGVRATRSEAESLVRSGAARNVLVSLGNLERHDVARARALLDRIPEAMRGWESRHVRSRLDQAAGGIRIQSSLCTTAFAAPGIAVVAAIAPGAAVPALSLLAAETVGKAFRVDPGDEPGTSPRGYDAIGLSGDGQMLATGRGDGAVDLFRVDWVETAATRLVRLSPAFTPRGVPASVSALAFSADRALLGAANTGGWIHVHDLRSRRTTSWQAHDGVISALAFDAAGGRLASAGWDSTAAVWSVPRGIKDSGECLARLRGHSGFVTSVAFGGGDRRLATGSLDRTIKVWDVEQSIAAQTRDRASTGVEVATLAGHHAGVKAVAFAGRPSQGKERLVSASVDRTLEIWEVGEWEPVSVLIGHEGPLRGVVSSPDGRWAASTGDLAAGGAEAKLWPLGVVEDVPVLRGHSSSVRSVASAAVGRGKAARTVLVSAGDVSVMVWDPETCRGLLRLRARPDGVVLDVAAQGGESSLLVAAAVRGVGVCLWEVTLEPHPAARGPAELACAGGGTVWTVDFSSDGRSIAAGCEDGATRLWRRGPRDEWRLEHTLRGHATGVRAVAFLAGGRCLASANGADAEDRGPGDWTLRVWDGASGEELSQRTLTHAAQALAFDAARDILAVGSASGTIELWDARNPRRPVLLRRLEGHTGAVLGLAFEPEAPPAPERPQSPLQRRLASGADDAEVKLWDVEAGTEVLALNQVGKAMDVCFSPDSRLLASASAGFEGTDNVVRLWETDASPAMRTARAWSRALERQALFALRGLITAVNDGAPSPAVVREAFALLETSDPAIDAVAVDTLELHAPRGDAAALHEVLSTLVEARDLPSSALERARRWARLGLERHAGDATLERLDARLHARLGE